MAGRFTGGIKTSYVKIPKNAETEAFFPKKTTLVLPDGYRPSVSTGDTVMTGDLLGECPDQYSILSGICGKVTVSGRTVTVESNGERTLSERCRPVGAELKEMSENELRSALYKMGVPVPEPGKKSPVCLTVNCCEEYPSSAAARMTVLERGASVIGGVKILMKLLGAKRAVCAVPRFMYRYANMLESYLPDAKTVKAVTVSDKYPQSHPQMLISSVHGIDINIRVKTDDAGYPVVSAGLCAAAYDALAYGIPYTADGVTVSGGGIDCIRCVKTPFGTDLNELAEYCGAKGTATSGYPGYTKIGDRTDKDVRTVVFEEDNPGIAVYPCIECGRCAGVCPVSLIPSMIAKSIEREGKSPEKLNAECCINCKCCDAVCPSGIPLSDMIAKNATGREQISADIQKI